MKRNWLIRTTWFWLLASVPSLAVYLWNPQATGYFFLVFAFCGWFGPLVIDLVGRPVERLRHAAVYTLWWICQMAFVAGAMMAAEEIIIDVASVAETLGKAGLLALLQFALVLVAEVLTQLVLAGYQKLSGFARDYAACAFFLAWIPNLLPPAYFGGFEMFHYYRAAEPYAMTVLLGFLALIAWMRMGEILLAAFVFPAVFFVGQAGERTRRALLAMVGTVVYLGLRWLADYWLLVQSPEMIPWHTVFYGYATTAVVDFIIVAIAVAIVRCVLYYQTKEAGDYRSA